MDEREALAVVEQVIDMAGDDAAIVDDLAISVDMLHARADYPTGVTPYTAGWRTVAVSLSDLAAVGATPRATLSVYSPPRFEREELEAYLTGARDASTAVGAEYVGGDLDITGELTTVGIAMGPVDEPVRRSGANPGDAVVVTGALGGGALAIELFDAGDSKRANEVFRIAPRIEAGQFLSGRATAMIDSSDGLARSLHHLAEASECGFAIDADRIPIEPRLEDVIDDASLRHDRSLFWGEDFELVATVPQSDLSTILRDAPTQLTHIGEVTDDGVTMNGQALADRGYSHE